MMDGELERPLLIIVDDGNVVGINEDGMAGPLVAP